MIKRKDFVDDVCTNRVRDSEEEGVILIRQRRGGLCSLSPKPFQVYGKNDRGTLRCHKHGSRCPASWKKGLKTRTNGTNWAHDGLQLRGSLCSVKLAGIPNSANVGV
jgi:hypothetical protein